jgi:hypothetical protein
VIEQPHREVVVVHQILDVAHRLVTQQVDPLTHVQPPELLGVQPHQLAPGLVDGVDLLLQPSRVGHIGDNARDLHDLARAVRDRRGREFVELIFGRADRKAPRSNAPRIGQAPKRPAARVSHPFGHRGGQRPELLVRPDQRTIGLQQAGSLVNDLQHPIRLQRRSRSVLPRNDELLGGNYEPINDVSAQLLGGLLVRRRLHHPTQALQGLRQFRRDLLVAADNQDHFSGRSRPVHRRTHLPRIAYPARSTKTLSANRPGQHQQLLAGLPLLPSRQTAPADPRLLPIGRPPLRLPTVAAQAATSPRRHVPVRLRRFIIARAASSFNENLRLPVMAAAVMRHYLAQRPASPVGYLPHLRPA